MFDTHCHLNFKRLSVNLDEIIESSRKVGVTHFVVPGTDIDSSKKAIEVAGKHDGVFAAIGIHPHHVFEMKDDSHSLIAELEAMVQHPKVVAVGEIGLDRHTYKDTKYEDYVVGEEFMVMQKELFATQLQLAVKYNKSVIIHSRETTDEVLETLTQNWNDGLRGRMVFHCCEPDKKMLDFALKNDVFIGVDGDVTYYSEKQVFIKDVPFERLVVETDSPFLLPEPLKSQKMYPNTPVNLPLIVDFVAKLKGVGVDVVAKTTYENGMKLFGSS